MLLMMESMLTPHQSPVNKYLLAVSNCPVFGRRTLETLASRFFSFEEVWNAPESAFHNLEIQRSRLDVFFAYRKKMNPERLMEILERHCITFLTKENEQYPALLKTIFDPPFVLFIKGELRDQQKVAIVGSRKATDYGRSTAYSFGKDLASHGITVVSGLAEGIDSAAHEGALKTGHTVAVLGSGILGKRSGEKEYLEKEIIEHGGAVISEFPLFAPGLKGHFPLRNRIIAGMADALLVIEAALPSGSLISAKCAIDEHRDVFAVPGPITSLTSAGTNDLIKQGAFVATEASDILTKLGINAKAKKKAVYSPASPLEEELFHLLRSGARHIDELLVELNTPHAELTQILISLELKGVIKNVGGMRYDLP